MDISAMSALTGFSYQNTLKQTGSGSQALTQALAASQSQINQMSTLLSPKTATTDAFATLAGASGLEAMAGLSYTTAAATGNGTSAIQSLLGSQNPGISALLPSADSMPQSATLLTPSTTAALARYAYDQSQNPASYATQAVTAGQQSLMASGWNLLV